MNTQTRRILVVTNETAGSPAVHRAVCERAGPASGVEVLVVAPALNTRLRHWLSDEDGAREIARLRLRDSLARLRAAGVRAEGLIGDADPLQAIEDALRLFPADELVLATHGPGRSHWLAHGLVERARSLGLPVTHVVAGEVAVAA
jgi:hypothetical protein